MAFTSLRDGNWEVYVCGHNPIRHHGADLPVWSPDGRRMAFTSLRDGNWEVYVMDADGHNPIRLTYHPSQDWSPIWSPDGERMAFSSFRDGNWNVYLLTLGGTP